MLNNIRSKESSLHNSLPVASLIESKASNASIVCHKCHHEGHIASRYPQRAWALDVKQSNLEDEEDQTVDPLDYYGDEDDLHEDCDDDMCVGVVRCVLSTTVDNDNWKRTNIFHSIMLDLLQGLQRESKDCEKDHYKNKTRKPNNTKMPSLVSVTISLKQIRRLPGAQRNHFNVCFPRYNGGQAVPQHLNTAPAN